MLDRHRIGKRTDLMPQQSPNQECRARIAVTGSSGLIGSRLTASLEEAGYLVHRLVRAMPRPGSTEVAWDPQQGTIDRDALE